MFPWSRKESKPTQSASPITIRDTLFMDEPLERAFANVKNISDAPWSHFAAAREFQRKKNSNAAIAELNKVIAMGGLESRIYLQAWNCLRELGVMPPANIAHQIQGVVVEYMLDKGLDLVAAYPNRSARYYNYSGAGVVWDARDPEIDKLIDDLLAIGQNLVNQTGPWDKARPAPPNVGSIRINLLTFGGLHFGQGGYSVLEKDPLGGPAIQSAVRLMQALMKKQTGHK